MSQHLKEFAGILIATVLVVDGLLHAYWATGHSWPAQDRLSLAQVVLNINTARSFRPTVLIPLACLLFCGALIVLARVNLLGMVGQVFPGPLLQLGVLVVAIGLLLRGLAVLRGCYAWRHPGANCSTSSISSSTRLFAWCSLSLR